MNNLQALKNKLIGYRHRQLGGSVLALVKEHKLTAPEWEALKIVIDLSKDDKAAIANYLTRHP